MATELWDDTTYFTNNGTEYTLISDLTIDETFTIPSGKTVIVSAGKIISVNDGGRINVLNGGRINVQTGGKINVNGGRIDVLNGGYFSCSDMTFNNGRLQVGEPYSGDLELIGKIIGYTILTAVVWQLIHTKPIKKIICKHFGCQ
jgi:hypothetical protein